MFRFFQQLLFRKASEIFIKTFIEMDFSKNCGGEKSHFIKNNYQNGHCGPLIREENCMMFLS